MKSVLKIVPLFLMTVLFCIFFASCSRPSTPRIDPDFKRLYESANIEPERPTQSEEGLRLVSVSADAVPLVDFLRSLSDQSGLSIIASTSIDKSLVTLEVRNSPVHEVLSAVARRLDVRLTRVGSIYYLGTISPEDRGFLVRRVRSMDAADLEKMIVSFHSEFGRSVVTPDGLVVVTDRVEVLDRLAVALSQLERLPSNSWVVQLYIFSISKNVSHTLGLDLSNTAKMSLVFSDINSSKLSFTGSFDAILNSVHNDVDSSVMAEPFLILRDGSEGIIHKGVTVPVPRKTVSPEGTISTTGFEYIDTGMKIKARLRDDSLSSCHGSFDIEFSDIVSYVEGSPVVKKQIISTHGNLLSGGIYLIASLDGVQESAGWSGSLLPSVFKSTRTAERILVWARTYRVGSPVIYGAVK